MRLADLCLQHGVMSARDANEFSKLSDELLSMIGDLQSRLCLAESIDREDIFDLRTKWKDGVRDFLSFRDVVRDTLNILVRGRLASVIVTDKIKTELDRFFLQMAHVDDVVQRLLRRA